MREFFKECVLNLYSYCGNRQAEKMTDEELKFLYDSLERISKLYSYIPEERQKEIIMNCLLTDKEYQNINVRTVAKWLELNGKHYHKEQAHQTIESNARPLEGEERAKWIETYLQAIASVTTNFTDGLEQKGNGARLREQLESSGIKKDPKKVSALEAACGVTEEMKEQQEESNHPNP